MADDRVAISVNGSESTKAGRWATVNSGGAQPEREEGR